MKLKDILNEVRLEKNVWTIIPHDEIEQYEKRLFDLIQTAYKKIGGNPNFSTPSDICNPKNNYDVVDVNDDDQPEAVNVSKKTSGGTKFVATGHDDSHDAKREILRHKIDLLNQPGYFAEVSGKIKDILISLGYHRLVIKT